MAPQESDAGPRGGGPAARAVLDTAELGYDEELHFACTTDEASDEQRW